MGVWDSRLPIPDAPTAALFFTDPPFGLPKVYDDPRKGRTASRSQQMERYLDVGNWDDSQKWSCDRVQER